MPISLSDLVRHLLGRLDEVQRGLGLEPPVQDADASFADVLDSMGMVELLALLADDCQVEVRDLEEACGHRFTTVRELAATLLEAGLVPREERAKGSSSPLLSEIDDRAGGDGPVGCWLAATAVRLPEVRQEGQALDALLGRPPGWFTAHTGIAGRGVWTTEEALQAATAAGQECLDSAAVLVDGVGALLVTSSAPPVLAGLAGRLHHRMGLPAQTVALEIGCTCTGFLAALWLARSLLGQHRAVLIVSVEVASRWFRVGPGAAGEAAALFGDGAAACVVAGSALTSGSRPVLDVIVRTDGGLGNLLQVRQDEGEGTQVLMQGTALAGRAIETLAGVVEEITARHQLAISELGAVVIHGGNGRLPGLVARRLGLPQERVWSETARLGNLASASVPVAWVARSAVPDRPVVWASVGAGLSWGAGLLGPRTGHASVTLARKKTTENTEGKRGISTDDTDEHG
jgi:3-oxoacyl-[acyl-carrier-protein] synthase-3